MRQGRKGISPIIAAVLVLAASMTAVAMVTGFESELESIDADRIQSSEPVGNVSWECISWEGNEDGDYTKTLHDFREAEKEIDRKESAGAILDHNKENLTFTVLNYNLSDYNSTTYVVGNDQSLNQTGTYFSTDVRFVECVKYRKILAREGSE